MATRRAPNTKKPPCVALQHTGQWVVYDAKASPTISANIAESVCAHHLCQRARHPPFQSFFDLGSLTKPATQENYKTQMKNVSLEFSNMIECGCRCKCVTVFLVSASKVSAVLPLWSDCPPRPSATTVRPTMLQATSRNKRTQNEEQRCELARRITPALPTTSETLVDEADGRKTVKNFGVGVLISQKNLQFAINSDEFGHKASCV